MRILWLVMLIIGLSSTIMSIILMIWFRIFHLMGELNGSNAKKQVEKLKKLNVNTSVTTGNLFINSDTGAEEEMPIKDFDLSKMMQETPKPSSGVVETVKSGPKERQRSNRPVQTVRSIRGTQQEVGTSRLDEDTSNATSYMDEVDSSKTSFIEEGDRTSFMDDLEDMESTSFIEDNIRDSESHIVILITEQSSLNLEESIGGM